MQRFATGMLIVCLAAAARAEEKPAGKAQPQWSLGAGFGSGGGELALPLVAGVGVAGGLGGLGMLTAYASVPTVSLMAERRLAPAVWLGFRVSGGAAVGQDTLPTTPKHTTTSESSSTAVNVTVGARWVVNPGGALEVSLLGGLGGGRTGSSSSSKTVDADKGETRTVDYSGSSLAVGATLGLAVERAVADGLAVRLASGIGSLSWSSSRSQTKEDQDAPRTSDGSRLGASLSISPSLEVRFYF